MRGIISAAIVAVLAGIVPAVVHAAHPPEAPAPDDTVRSVLATVRKQSTQAARSCDAYTYRHYEACHAYVIDASLEARLPFEIFGRSSSAAWSGFVARQLQTRYRGQALRYLRHQSAAWPTVLAKAAVPTISVNSIRLNDAQDQATLTTHETWRVTSSLGPALLHEANKQHTIIMRRTSGAFHHTWIVTNIE